MKKLLTLMICIFALSSAACGGNVRNVKIIEGDSEKYSDEEINEAIDETLDYFEANFSGCTLTEISYAGDEKTEMYLEWAKRHDAYQVIVLISSFDTDSSGGDGSLNPNSSYDNWLWILVRSEDGEWKHVDHGY